MILVFTRTSVFFYLEFIMSLNDSYSYQVSYDGIIPDLTSGAGAWHVEPGSLRTVVYYHRGGIPGVCKYLVRT